MGRNPYSLNSATTATTIRSGTAPAKTEVIFKIACDVQVPHLRDERRKLPLPRVDEIQEGTGPQEGQVIPPTPAPVVQNWAPKVDLVSAPITTRGEPHTQVYHRPRGPEGAGPHPGRRHRRRAADVLPGRPDDPRRQDGGRRRSVVPFPSTR